ncbi:retrotransposon protein [Cucumis melo var. makuwa]|uniref:Retrotransposon protein n=1 Tax=Cucumis melo var. makuwa TaxID=1194695 RepID=A0A5A7SVA3_CUCMM|nr:retrotransposon protein [Cucumis melo var. makuwa]
MNEKEIRELKEMMLSLFKSMENLSEEIKESNRARLREESCASEGSRLKGKGNVGETDMTLGFAEGSSKKSKYKKLEMPVFNGENPKSWIYRVEHYFEINKLADEEKVKVAVVSFGSDALNWFRWSNNRKKMMSWEDLKRRMFEHFKAPDEAPLPEMSESVLIDAFITGLETNLQAEVISHHPVTLEDCMREAQMAESQVKCLSDSEFRARLDKGLCFHCNDKYSLGHRCKGKTNRELMVFITNAEEELENEKEKEEVETEEVEFETLEVKRKTEISLRTILGFTSKGTMKLRGTIKGRKVIILIDSGATHNFIHQGIVQELALSLHGKTKFGVTIGDGTTLEGKGICKKIEAKLPKLTIVEDFLVIELGRIDLVLGMQWLSTTRFMGIHWPSMMMVFMAGTTHVVLKGDPSLTKAECSLITIFKTWEEEDHGFLLEFQGVEIKVDTEDESEKEEEGEESKLPMIRNLLTRYRSIFETPKGLPPKRTVDHRIVTLDGQKPINVRPYKYGYIQKEEIEKLVSEMLQAGIIRPSRSPYSSLMLLVKKRNLGWRFCIDYRKLNQHHPWLLGDSWNKSDRDRRPDNLSLGEDMDGGL